MAGARTDEVPEALVDCHQRLRQVVGLTCDLAARDDAPAGEVRELARKVLRYFTIAFRLHEADEEVSLFPRLLARVPALAPTLARLHADDAQQQARVASLVALARDLEAAPDSFPARRARLAAAARDLLDAWSEHLAIEEAEVFPAVRTALPPAERAAIEEEMRLRRAELPPR